MVENESPHSALESKIMLPEKILTTATPEDVVRLIGSGEMTQEQLLYYLKEKARRENILHEEKRELQKVAFADVLVEHSMNRRGYDHMMDNAFERALAQKKSLSELNFDGDAFKQVNDFFGHDGGDKLIQLIDLAVSRATREEDIMGRIGGDEFRVGLPETDENGAIEVAKRIQEMYIQLQTDIIAGVDIGDKKLQADFPALTLETLQTLSIGIATSGNQQGIFTLKQLGKCSDVAMYRSKKIKHMENRLGELGYIPVNERAGKISVYREHSEPLILNPHSAVVGPVDVIRSAA